MGEEGFEIQGPDERALDLMECESPGCAESVLESLSADFGIAIALWARARGGIELAVTLYFPDATSRDFALGLDSEDLAPVRGLAADVARTFRGFEPEREATRPSSSITRPSVANYVLGGIGLALAVPALTIGSVTVARRGECVETESGDCDQPSGVTREVYVGPRTIALFAAGGVFAGVSTYVLIKRPIRVSVAPSTSGIFVVTQGTF